MLNLPVYLYTPVIRVFLDLENATNRGVDHMYHGYATIAKGLSNTIQFHFLNGDQRPIAVDSKSFVFKMFDVTNNKEVLSQDLTIIDDGTTFALKGKTKLELSGNQTRDLNTGKYTYSVLQVDGAVYSPVFIDGASKVAGVVDLVDSVVPKFIPSDDLRFLKVTGYYGNPNTWSTGPNATNRDGKGSNDLHTAQLYFTNFTGNLKVFATLDNTATTTTWVEVDSLDYANQTDTLSINLENITNFNYVKFEYIPVTGTIDKVLYRS